jgi:hypothetical protein
MKSATANQQLRLVDPARSWRIDAQTREIGRVGVEKARLVLQHSLREPSESTSDQQDDSRAA